MIVLFVVNMKERVNASPPPAPLPEFRVTEGYPFANTGCDFARPLYCKHSRNAPEEKIYICIFTCCSTRSAHLELVSDLTAECFLKAFR